MRISTRDWQRYIRKLSAINEAAANRMAAWMSINPNADIRALIAKAQEISSYYGEAAASLACEMYDAIANVSGVAVASAEPAAVATGEEVGRAINGTMKNGDNSVPATVSRLVKQAGADTMLKNAERDGAQFAWVPVGDTCAFCMTLASRGWQYMSRDAMRHGHAEHIHANCDCTYAVRFDERSSVSGYDPDRYKRIYEEAEGDTPEEKINAMRRDIYAKEHEEG